MFTPFSVTRLARCAEAEGCEIRSIRERDESLESQDGTLRNKLIAGHARGRVYAAYLVAAVAGCFAITLAWLLSAAVGVAKLGWFTAPAGTLGLAAALILLLTAAEAALLPDGSIRFENSAAKLGKVQAERLFDRFFTVESASGSTGLGLSIARELTERLGGTIGADYQAGRLRICVSFPE